jgi:hypothetical protein
VSAPPSDRRPSLAASIGLYTLARLGLVAVVAGLLVLAGVPLLIAVMVGLIVALPLSMVLFRGLRGRLDAALARTRERRSAERAALRGRLRGDAEPAPPDPSPRAGDDSDERSDQGRGSEPDRGEH